MFQIRTMRTFLGSMVDPNTAWLISRSLETLKVRMDRQAVNARKVADYLKDHPQVERLYYPGHLEEADGRQYDIFRRQCLSGGGMISFDIKGGEKEAFAFLNALKVIKLAVSLGSSESLAEHPASMTHAGVPVEERLAHGITDQLVRLSIGLEHHEDLLADLEHAFLSVEKQLNPSDELIWEELHMEM
jgi:methionine-gamma-lyase